MRRDDIKVYQYLVERKRQQEQPELEQSPISLFSTDPFSSSTYLSDLLVPQRDVSSSVVDDRSKDSSFGEIGHQLRMKQSRSAPRRFLSDTTSCESDSPRPFD